MPIGSASPSMSAQSSRKKASRTREGCLTCRRDAKVKCDQLQPVCGRCNRLELHCRWEENRLTLKERRRLEAKKWAAAPPDIRPARKTSELDQVVGTAAIEHHLGGPFLATMNLALQGSAVLAPGMFDNGASSGLTYDILDSIWNQDSNVADPFLRLSPAADMILGTETVYAGLPGLISLTRADHEALNSFQKEVIFGLGSKTPAWSTHAILLHSGSQQPMVLHLLLAASLTEIGWQRSALGGTVIEDAERHYQLGRDLLLDQVHSTREPDHLATLASFWFLYLYQRRHTQKRSMSYRDLSSMMGKYVGRFRLRETLSSSAALGCSTNAASHICPQRASLLARLVIWLFWADAQSCFQGEGGSLARHLLQSPEPLSSEGILDIFESSRPTLELYWGQRYPDLELEDDLKNGGALELLHRTWVIVQEINEETGSGPLSPERSHEIKGRMDALRTRFPFSSVFRLSESPTTVRDRLMGNSDWACCNYYALRIYHFRCGIGGVETAEGGEVAVVSAGHLGFGDVDEVVARLLVLIQKSLAASERGQIDRLQWPLFWAGLETSDPIYREWVLLKLIDPGLQAALKLILLEQSGVGRIGIDRIRRICQENCNTGPGSEVEWISLD